MVNFVTFSQNFILQPIFLIKSMDTLLSKLFYKSKLLDLDISDLKFDTEDYIRTQTDIFKYIKTQTDFIICREPFNKNAIELNYVSRCMLIQTNGPEILQQVVNRIINGNVCMIDTKTYIFNNNWIETDDFKTYFLKIVDNINRIDYDFVNSFTDTFLKNFTGIAMYATYTIPKINSCVVSLNNGIVKFNKSDKWTYEFIPNITSTAEKHISADFNMYTSKDTLHNFFNCSNDYDYLISLIASTICPLFNPKQRILLIGGVKLVDVLAELFAEFVEIVRYERINKNNNCLLLAYSDVDVDTILDSNKCVEKIYLNDLRTQPNVEEILTKVFNRVIELLNSQ